MVWIEWIMYFNGFTLEGKHKWEKKTGEGLYARRGKASDRKIRVEI